MFEILPESIDDFVFLLETYNWIPSITYIIFHKDWDRD